MNVVFVDALYWIAQINRKDQWHERAMRAEATLAGARFVTTEAVLVEVLNYLGGYGPSVRRSAARVLRRVLEREDVEVVEQTRDDFLAGLALYEARPDKGYSLTDCISMKTMRERGITAVLTHDHHFAQEGFAVLL